MSKYDNLLEKIFSFPKRNHHGEYFAQSETKELITSLLFMYIQSENTDYKQVDILLV